MNSQVNQDRNKSQDPCRAGDFSASLMGAALLVLCLLPQVVYLQSKDDFGVNKMIRDVKKQYHLSTRDLKSLRPLINQENRNVFEIYVRFSGDEPEYSGRVWQEIISRRRGFESNILQDLSVRQRSALRAARTAMERRIMNYLVQDFVSFLGDVLELRDWEYTKAQELFETESTKKYLLIAAHLSEPVLLQTEMEKISKDTERHLQKLLSAEQWRGYRDLTESAKLIALLQPGSLSERTADDADVGNY